MAAYKAYQAAALLLLAAARTHAAEIPAMDFARQDEVFEVALAPDGKHLAIARPMPDGNETRLEIIEVATGKTQILRFGRLEHVSDIVWTDNDRVVLARASNKPLQPRPYSRGQLFSTDLTGARQKVLFGYFKDNGGVAGRRKDEGFASVAKVLDAEPGKMLVTFRCWDCGEEPDTVIYKVDAASGERNTVERIPGQANVVFDNKGVARISTTADNNDRPVLRYRRAPTDNWQPLPKSLIGYEYDFAVFDQDDNKVYAAVSDNGEPARMYRLDLAAGTRTALTDPQSSAPASYQRAGRGLPPFAVIYDENKPVVQPLGVQNAISTLYSNLLKMFPGQMVAFDSFSRDNQIVLFHVWSDRNPGGWYLHDRGNGKTTVVAESRPWIKPDDMAGSKPIEFKTDDGLTLHGFYTAADQSTRPLVVLPHGGPHGVYDSWGFDPDVQFFANRGYGVLQVNFRGSGGRGEQFLQQGYKQWGGRMQDDIAAGVRWAVDNKLADPKRICTFGASYGGYAALMQPIRYPDLYRCAIGYVGVYDLALMKKSGDIDDTRRGRRYLDRALGTDEAALTANSPARNVDKIKVPVFLAQGDIDQRVPMAQFKALKNALERSGVKVDTMVASGEGHGFYKPENRAELYKRSEAFLKQNIGQ